MRDWHIVEGSFYGSIGFSYARLASHREIVCVTCVYVCVCCVRRGGGGQSRRGGGGSAKRYIHMNMMYALHVQLPTFEQGSTTP